MDYTDEVDGWQYTVYKSRWAYEEIFEMMEKGSTHLPSPAHYTYLLDWSTRNGNNVGFKYVGLGEDQNQEGLNIMVYQKDQGENLGGLKIELGFKDSKGKYDDLRWVQTIWSSSHKRKQRSPYNDSDDKLPFYYTEEETSFHQNRGGFRTIKISTYSI
jgi:hypothetical protein